MLKLPAETTRLSSKGRPCSSIVSVALGLGYGLGANSAVLAHMPQAITLIFGGSGIVPAALFAIILNIVLPPDEKSEVEIAEEILDMKKKETQKK